LKSTLTIQHVRQQIWKAAKKKNEVITAAKQSISFNDSEPDYTALLKEVRKLTKKPRVVTDDSWRARYRQAHIKHQEKEYPNAIRDQEKMGGNTKDWGDCYLETVYPDDNTTNGLTNIVVRFLTYAGHFANCTANKGTAISTTAEKFNVVSGKLDTIQTGTKFIPSKSKNGMQDIDCNLKHPDHKHGIPWKIEIKAGADTHKKNQEKFGEKVSATGAVYSVVRNAIDFFNQFDKLMEG
jgi:hypothetical protein